MCFDREVVIAAMKKEIEIEIKGDAAVLVVPWTGRRAHLRQASNGAWYATFAPRRVAKLADQTKWITRIYVSTNIGFDAVLKNVTKEGITIIELKKISRKAERDYYKSFKSEEADQEGEEGQL